MNALKPRPSPRLSGRWARLDPKATADRPRQARSSSATALDMRSARAVLVTALILLAAPTWAASTRASAIRRFAQQWLGTPYQWGGTTRAGIDCSAFLREMYRRLFKVELPRTTKQQIHLGRSIRLDRKDLAKGLEPGDVLFYVDRTGVPNHVVTYAGQRRITHSVSGRGVVVEPIDKLYGRRLVARRLLMPAAKQPSNRHFGSALPPSDNIEIVDVPCPARYKPAPAEIKLWIKERIEDDRTLKNRDLCELKALKRGLERHKGAVAAHNVHRLETLIDWQERIGEASAWLGGN